MFIQEEADIEFLTTNKFIVIVLSAVVAIRYSHLGFYLKYIRITLSSELAVINEVLHFKMNCYSYYARDVLRFQKTAILPQLNKVVIKKQGIGTKSDEVFKELARNNMDIVALTETKKKGKGTEEKHDYIHIYSGVPKEDRGRSGVSIAIHKKFRKQIKSILQLNEQRQFGVVVLQSKLAAAQLLQANVQQSLCTSNTLLQGYSSSFQLSRSSNVTKPGKAAGTRVSSV
nr:unnamed protein product [Callosobruchus chinensis]